MRSTRQSSLTEAGVAPDMRICFIGDSYVVGAGDPTMLGWAGRVAAAVASAGLPLTYYNLGVRGHTGPDIAARVRAEVQPRLDPADDPRLVVSFGANDTVEVDGKRRATLADSLAALECIRTSIDAPVLVVGPPAVDDDAQNRRLAELDAALHESADHAGVPYVDLLTSTSSSQLWRREIASSDGYHPGAQGYEHLARIITPEVLRWLRSL